MSEQWVISGRQPKEGNSVNITGSISLSAATSDASGNKNVASAGTAEPLAATATKIISVTVKAKRGNTGNIYVGDSGVSSANGFILTRGEAISLDIDDLNKVYIDADTTSEGVTFISVSD